MTFKNHTSTELCTKRCSPEVCVFTPSPSKHHDTVPVDKNRIVRDAISNVASESLSDQKSGDCTIEDCNDRDIVINTTWCIDITSDDANDKNVFYNTETDISDSEYLPRSDDSDKQYSVRSDKESYDEENNVDNKEVIALQSSLKPTHYTLSSMLLPSSFEARRIASEDY